MSVLTTDHRNWLIKTGDMYITFGERLKNARIDSGLTQLQLSFRMGVDRSTVSRWENGALSIEADDLIRFIDATGKTELIKYYCWKCPISKKISHGGPSKPTVA